MSDAAELRERTTGLLVGAATDGAAAETLFPLVYDELRRLARRQLSGELTGHTLSTTALVHEAYIRLIDGSRVGPVGRGYFFGAAARAMRRILVEHARRRRAAKRGGGMSPVSLGDGDAAADAYADELIDLDRALEELATLNPRHAQVVECRFFGGLNVEETAAVLGVSDRTVKSDWAVARAWLRQAMGG